MQDCEAKALAARPGESRRSCAANAPEARPRSRLGVEPLRKTALAAARKRLPYRAAGERRTWAIAAAAHDGLVEPCISDLREHRIGGLRSAHEFTERRVGPAMNTCRCAAGRLESVSQRSAQQLDEEIPAAAVDALGAAGMTLNVPVLE